MTENILELITTYHKEALLSLVKDGEALKHLCDDPKETREHKIRYSGHDNAVDDFIALLKSHLDKEV